MPSSAEHTLVLVEDDPEARNSLAQILELEGFSVMSFANGAEALEYLTQRPPPCLVLMDIQMPLMDGAQLRAAMLRDRRLAAVPVFVITAVESSVAAARIPTQRVFRKPLDLDNLLRALQQYC
jgi:CheY-like chemotaxis protein